MRPTAYLPLAILVIVALLVACAPGAQLSGSGGTTGTSTEPIRIGVLATQTGALAANGTDMLDGWKLWWTENGDTVAGRKLEMFYEDDGGNPDVALNKARQLVEQRNVHMLVGVLPANAGLAVAQYVKDTGTPYFIPIVSADDLTQRERIPNVLRIAGWTSSQTTHPLGEWAAEQGYKTALTIGQDFAFGHETVGGFVKTFTDKGGTIVAQLWNPIGTPDFSSYLAQIQDTEVDVVFAQESGADAVRFIKGWNEFGLKDKVPLLGGATLMDQSGLRSMGPEAEGTITVAQYAEGRDDPNTQKFVEAFDKAYQRLPSYYAANMYTAARWLTLAIEQVNGNVEDTENFLKVVGEISFDDAPMGPVKMDEYGNPILNVYLRRSVKRDDGRLWNIVEKEWPAVSQFWTYDPEEFLKQPVYSRDYQGID